MGDTLTQDQIDALLNSAFSGETIEEVKEEPKDVIKEYDFKAPKKFTRDRMKTISSIFESYARMVSSYLTGMLRLYCKVTLLNVEEQNYFEFNNALPDYVVMGIGELDFNNDDCEELTMIIQLSNALTFLMIERLLGGNGKAASVDRDFTEIEVSIMQEITEQFAKIMKEPWQSVANVTPKLKKIETNARMVTGMSFDDVMIIAALEVVVSDSSSIISVCIPARALEENMQKLASAGAVQIHRKININKENERRETIMKTLADSKLEVKAILGNVNLDVSDVLNLQINDVIPLKKSIGSNVPIMVGDKLWFDGKVGIYNNNKAVKIERVLKKQPKNTNEFIELFPAN